MRGRTASGLGGGFQAGQIFHIRQRGESAGVVAELGLEGGEFRAEFAAAGGILERASQREAVPLGGEGADDLVEHRNGELGEFARAGAVSAEDVAGQREKGVDAFQRSLFVAVRRRQVLGGDASEQFDVKLPGRGAVGVARGEFALEETEVQFEAGKPPLFKEVAAFHRGKVAKAGRAVKRLLQACARMVRSEEAV